MGATSLTPSVEAVGYSCSDQQIVIPSEKRVKHRHLFVDNVRFWSMLAIVTVHGMGILNLRNGSDRFVLEAFQTPLKFGTTGFFLISGFLLGERVQTSNPIEYLGRRIRKVFLPWLVWITLLSTYLLVLDAGRHRVLVTWRSVVPLLLHQAFLCLVSTTFWFVPNLLLALVVLLVFRRYLYDRRLGAALLAVQVFYMVNIYTRWIPSSHLEALLGFVFDLWLGSYASRYITELNQWVARVKVRTLVGLAVTTCLLAFEETRLLDYLHAPDPLNTLRASNQVFSIVMVLLILKLRTATWLSFVNVRRDTYGIYLTHAMFLAICLNVLNQIRRSYFSARPIHPDIRGILIWIGLSAVVYLGSLTITRLLAARPQLRWLVGAEA